MDDEGDDDDLDDDVSLLILSNFIYGLLILHFSSLG